LDNKAIREPSSALIEAVGICELRQAWYRGYLLAQRTKPLKIVASIQSGTDIVAAANSLRRFLGIEVDQSPPLHSGEDAFYSLVDLIETSGVLVMVNSMVNDNPHRPLDVSEFRGFALVDEYAPIIFVNSADSRNAMRFTLIHELCHVALGQSSISNASMTDRTSSSVEKWCNAVTAEFFVPASQLKGLWESVTAPFEERLQELSKKLRVSQHVIYLQLIDAGLANREEYEEWNASRSLSPPKEKGGRSTYYNSKPRKVSKRFGRAVIANVAEGELPEYEARKLLQLGSLKTLLGLADTLRIPLRDMIEMP
jgi:Zn-dependent peptidase ImmA (M78 family)